MGDQPRYQAFRGSEQPAFANEAERECAAILDFHGIPWAYEPTTFPLEVAEDGAVLEAFTPDFYLPEQDLYLEITTMKQSLVTKKNRKVRRLRELHPEVRVKLFYRSDVEALAMKYELDEAS
jgi:hypoxanthine phosphoribosyltransferase